MCSSPQLFAAYHVLHRLPVPRHPPCALCYLTISIILACTIDAFSGSRDFSRLTFANLGMFLDYRFVSILCLSAHRTFDYMTFIMNLCFMFSRICGFQGTFSMPSFFLKSELILNSGTHLLSRTVSSEVPSAVRVLTVVFGMGTGVSP